MQSDTALQTSVLEELRWEPGVKATDIGVTVKDGVVTIEGTVDSYAEKWAAERAVKRLSGVKALAVEINVKLPGPSERTDADTAEAARNALKWDVLIPQDRIRVTVGNGFLTLEGEVDWQFQRSAAERVVRYLTGVTGIANEITVKPKVAPTDVKAKIEAALQRNAILDAQDIKVQADGGKVTLSGRVRSWAERDEAEDAAWAAPGVKEVKDLIAVTC
ncbi:MAG TPA: BON domain-containing protein [Terriglobia bacterium]|nr:BON domain-containing protein [Terriglobia bacterium]